MDLSKAVKLPVLVFNQKQADMGMDNPDEGEMSAYFSINSIVMIRQAHDEGLGDTLNTEHTALHLISGESFMIPLYIDEVLKLIQDANR